ncbi:MAG: ATP-binding protein [Gemmatimonadota bacterium]|nr:ATP-binding protein [Gemmatimonadota bacterium]
MTTLFMQSGVALVLALVLTWLWRARRVDYLRWISASWWSFVTFTGASGIAFLFALRRQPSYLWDLATFTSQTTVVLHAVFMVAGVRVFLRRTPPTASKVWLGVIAAVAFGIASVLLPADGPAGAPSRQFIRGTLPGFIISITYVSLIPSLWRARRAGAYGTQLLVAALGFSTFVSSAQALASTAALLNLPGALLWPPWYPMAVLSQAMFALAWSGMMLEAEQGDRVEAAERANRADRMLREALDASDDLIGVVDQMERLVLCNDRMAATITEVTGVKVTPFMPYPRPGRTEGERKQFLSTIQRALRGERVHERSEVFTTTGRRILLDRHIVPIREAGAVTGAFVVARDVTDDEALRREAERAMRIEAMARMAGGLAHDFNNILTVVQTNLQLLTEAGEHDAESMDIIMETAGALDRANVLTRRLLGVARDPPTVAARVDAAALLRDSARFLQHAIGEEVVLDLSVPTSEAFVTIDPGRLEQVLLNLSLNARDAMPTGGNLRIRVRHERLDAGTDPTRTVPPGEYVSIAVTDEGSGMDDDTLRRAGDPFFTTKPGSVGSGLGLATCRAILTEAKGTLLIQSKPDVGTTVTLLLPST